MTTPQPTIIIERDETMKGIKTLAVLACLAALTVAATDASAYLHPTLGCFMSRDPGPGGAVRVGAAGPAVGGGFVPRDPTGSNQYADGMNLYQYVKSTPVNGLDPWGLWKIKRTGKPKAIATAEKGRHVGWGVTSYDRISDLAKEIGLDFKEFSKWGSFPNGGSIRIANGGGVRQYMALFDGRQPGHDPQICPGETVEIPNTVLAPWAGWEGLGQAIGMFYVRWNSDIGDLKSRGFYVVEIKNKTAKQVLARLNVFTKSASLHGFLFWGHGGPRGLVTKESENGVAAYSLQYADVTNPAKGLQYKLGFGMVYSCYGKSAKAHMMAPGAAFWGGPDLLIPGPFHGNAPYVDQVLSGKK